MTHFPITALLQELGEDIMKVAAFALLLSLVPCVAAAQTWRGTEYLGDERDVIGCTSGPTPVCTYGASRPANQLAGNEIVVVQCIPGRLGCGTDDRYGYIRLSEFATATDLAQMQIAWEGFDARLDEGVALASALDFQGPAPGYNNRAAASASAYRDEAAISLSYSGRLDRFDFSAGVAATNNNAMGKASFGVSW